MSYSYWSTVLSIQSAVKLLSFLLYTENFNYYFSRISFFNMSMNVFPIINLKINVSKTKKNVSLGCFTNYRPLNLKNRGDYHAKKRGDLTNCGEYRSRTDDLYGASVAL